MFKSKAKKPIDDTKPDNFALAYNISKKSKKMAKGGEVPDPKNTPAPDLHKAADDAMKDVTDNIDSRMKDRQAKGKPGYALGGAITGPTRSKSYSRNPGTPAPKPDDSRPAEDTYMGDKWAKGGMVPESDLDRHATSIADAILDKRHRMAQGGMVDLNSNSEEVGRSPYDEDNAESGNEEQYDLDQLSDQPEDSNEHADALDDADAHSMVDKIRAKLRAKRS